MKRLLPVLFLCLNVCPLAAGEPDAITRIATTDGKTYEQVSSLKVAPNQVRFIHRDGTATVRMDHLPADLQSRFGYDPDKAAEADAKAAEAARKARAAANKANAAQAIRDNKKTAALARAKNRLGAAYWENSRTMRIYRSASAEESLLSAGYSESAAKAIMDRLKSESHSQPHRILPAGVPEGNLRSGPSGLTKKQGVIGRK